MLQLPGAVLLANQIEGQVVKIGEDGNLLTDIAVDQVSEIVGDDTVVIKFGGHETIGLFPADHDQPDATMVASVGHSGFVEIEIVGISLAEMLGIKVDEPVAIIW